MNSVRGLLERRRNFRADDGAAIVEFIGLSLLLLVPLVYVVLTLGRIQAGAFAAEAAAADAARGAVVEGVEVLEAGGSGSEARASAFGRAQAVAAVVVADFGFDPGGDSELVLGCTASPCFAPGSDITARATIDVPLPGIPGFITAIAPFSVAVSGTAASPVDGLADES